MSRWKCGGLWPLAETPKSLSPKPPVRLHHRLLKNPFVRRSSGRNPRPQNRKSPSPKPLVRSPRVPSHLARNRLVRKPRNCTKKRHRRPRNRCLFGRLFRAALRPCRWLRRSRAARRSRPDRCRLRLDPARFFPDRGSLCPLESATRPKLLHRCRILPQARPGFRFQFLRDRPHRLLPRIRYPAFRRRVSRRLVLQCPAHPHSRSLIRRPIPLHIKVAFHIRSAEVHRCARLPNRILPDSRSRDP